MRFKMARRHSRYSRGNLYEKAKNDYVFPMTQSFQNKDLLFSIKMRACKGAPPRHVSGAERIAPPGAAAELAKILTMRALDHDKGAPDAINIKIESIVSPCQYLDSLPVRAFASATPQEGLKLAAEFLKGDGIAQAAEILAMLPHAANMRGALLLDADTLARLDDRGARGVRASCMDEVWTGGRDCLHKDHYREALILATKVAHAPGIVAEICVSDDPHYITGYVASRTLGYIRLQCMKMTGSPQGGRIFLFRGTPRLLEQAVSYLETTPVLVRNIPPAPDFEQPDMRHAGANLS